MYVVTRLFVNVDRAQMENCAHYLFCCSTSESFVSDRLEVYRVDCSNWAEYFQVRVYMNKTKWLKFVNKTVEGTQSVVPSFKVLKSRKTAFSTDFV